MNTPLRAVPRLRSAAPSAAPARPASALWTSAFHFTQSSTAPAWLASLASRRLISVAGPDAAKYLQGVVTASILRLNGSAGVEGTAVTQNGLYTAFLSAQGRVLHDVIVYRDTLGAASAKSLAAADNGDDGGAFLIEVDADEAATLTKHIKRYKLRAKFDVRLLDADELTVWHGWGQEQAEAETAGAIVYQDTRAPGLGWRFVSAAAPRTGFATVDEAHYRVHRYRLGVAEGQREILRNTALPLESNMDLMGGIDYHKGCYVGQELTIRTKHRGVVRKRILPCIVYADGDEATAAAATDAIASLQGELPPFDTLGLADIVPAETSIGRVGRKGRSAGKWLSGVGNIGLALCRLETMTDVVLPDEAAAASAAAGFDPTSEFVLNIKAAETEGEAAVISGEAAPTLKIKAIVPAWLRQGLAPKAA
ncbi:folate-binding protein [Ophiostoma piceae UAMH 11346]|uniref:Iron-sulfur cluster assembly factor IBA57 homolog, mitochondrial n=1 Tax=Ophiostoma piceae (strain UAMH 11346) TaxID=1262450 RepID=S3CB97_OPHP1|nr:folate-binding protein [Ophiostoma piceae UAMH 11346]